MRTRTNRRTTPGSRSATYPSRWLRVVGWSTGALVGLGALLTLAYLAGRDQPDASADLWNSILLTLAKPAVALGVGFGLLMIIAWCCRNLLFERLGFLPGRIDVPDFTAGSDLNGDDPAQLTMQFRQRLSISHLQTLNTVPTTSAQGDFLDVLGRGGVDSKNPIGSLLSLVRAASPTYAYEIRGVLVRGRGRHSFGATVQVVRLPGEAGAVVELWDSSWAAVIRRAADHATAAILPRTRLCRAPWGSWRRYQMPGELLHHYEQAAELDEERRYDEALDHYYEALQLDPLNVALRLQIGFLQEKLALFLDALATYQGLIEVAESGGREAQRVYRRPARGERAGALLIARYRRAVLLAQHELGAQWRRTGPADEDAWTERDLERRRLRQRLEPAVAELADAYGHSHRSGAPHRVGTTPASELLEEPPPGCGQRAVDRRAELELQELLQLIALEELADLSARARGRGDSVTRAAAGLSYRAVLQRLHWTQSVAGRRAWRPRASDIRSEVAEVEPRSGFRRWEEHYNAACIYALPLLPPPDGTEEDEQRRDGLADGAVQHLESAMAFADSAYIAGHRDWLVSEDPDLDGLRCHPRFKHFEAMFFPSATKPPERPREVHGWELSRYTDDLLAATARRWAACWRGRGQRLDDQPELQAILDWLEVEGRAWEAVRRVAINHRHWRARVDLIAQMQRWGIRFGFEPLAVGFPGYSDGSLPETRDGDTDPEAARIAKNRRDARLARLAQVVEATEPEQHKVCSLVHDLRSWQAELRQLDGMNQRTRRQHVARLCDAHASLWQRLSDWLDAPEDGASASQFEAAIARAVRLWQIQELRWRTGDYFKDLPLRRRSNGVPPEAKRAAAALEGDTR